LRSSRPRFTQAESVGVSAQALPMQTFLHPDAHADGGLAFVDKQLLESQRAAVLQLMKEVGIQLSCIFRHSRSHLKTCRHDGLTVCRLARNC